MDVKKIFVLLITVVALVMVGALILNILLPNVAVALVDAVEGMIFNATGMEFDFNNNGNVGSGGMNYTSDDAFEAGGAEGAEGENVQGFEGN